MARESKPMSWKAAAIWLFILFALALTLRVAFNVDASDSGERYLYSGNDPYYHDRTVGYIMDNGESLIRDDVINYPHGGNNPNPPLYDWVAAMDAGFLEAMGVSEERSVSMSLNFMAGLWGALTILPVYVIAAELFGRRAGVWSAFLMAVSAPHIQRGVWGFADHDATTMFFIVLAMAFMVKGLRSLDHREYVSNWRDSDARMAGVRTAFAKNKVAFTWAALVGVSLSATALTWKGYPYVLAIMAVAVFLQLLLDHARNKDSTAMFTFYLIPLILVAVIPFLYYNQFPGFLRTTITPGLYVLLGVVIAGAILVPTRDLPSILVFPGLALAGIIGLLLLLLPFSPLYDVGRTIFTGLGYFQQTKLYTTIAEAQRTELGLVAASFGFFTFLLAFWFWGRSARKAWKGDAAHLLMVAWSLVAVFMAFAASRFVMNAAPVFAVLAGASVAHLAKKIGWSAVAKKFRQQHGQNPVVAGINSISMKPVIGVLLVAALIVLPNLWLGVDAATPSEFEQENELSSQRFGAFGLSYDIKTNGWLQAFDHLATLDGELAMEDRPAFIAWWDYGHWATNLGHHPTVADPFQNHFNVAGRFLASETEHEAMTWLTLLVLNGDASRNGGYSAGVADYLQDAAPGLSNAGRLAIDETGAATLAANVADDELVTFYDGLTKAAGKRVQYVGADLRMWPLGADSSGIFYAPVFLADKNPDEFLENLFIGQQASGAPLTLKLEQYGTDEDGISFRLDEARWIDQTTGERWTVIGNEAYPGDGSSIGATTSGVPVQQRLIPTEKFQNSMYARSFGGPTVDSGAGNLDHFRLIHQSTTQLEEVERRDVVLLEFYTGTTLEGRVVDELGRSMSGVTVTFEDGYGGRHHSVETGDDGQFSIIAPFSVDDDLSLLALRGDTIIAETGAYQFSRDDMGTTQTGAELVVPLVTVSGMAYDDRDDDGVYNASVDQPISANVTLGDLNTTSGPNGMYTFEFVQPGEYTMTANADGYNMRTEEVSIADNLTQDFALDPTSSPATITVTDDNGRVEALPMTLEGPVTRTATTNSTGMATTSLPPGAYTFKVDYTATVDDQQIVYKHEQEFTVPFGGDPVNLVFTVSRS